MSETGAPGADGTEIRRRQLRRARARATGLLVAVTVLFVVVTVRGAHGPWSWVQATAEASMVGGAADWFAVTALFRRPLGLPIPHTAVVVERKDRFGETLGTFVQESFLNGEALVARLRQSRWLERVAAWLSDPDNASRAAAHLATLAAEATALFSDEDVHLVLAAEARHAADRVAVAPAAGRAIGAITEADAHRELFDAFLRSLDRLIEQHHDELRVRFRTLSPRWVPGAVDDAVFQRAWRRARHQLHEVAVDPNHELRARFYDWLDTVAERLQSDQAVQARVEKVKDDVLGRVELRSFAVSVWDQLKDSLRRGAADESSPLRGRLADAIAGAGVRLATEPELRAAAERAAEDAVRTVAHQFRGEVTALVSTTIARWDAADTADRLELLLGPDLQFIRINGTVVGAAVGVAIHALTVAIG
ncbi:MAG TPA: DUF445 domain-containing protein [Acidimicrobiales bacterium]|nr:DUF445 domain-containing protein [Acidimicrobiales bacterium]